MNEFDRKSRNRLSMHESPMDVNSFWDQLEPKLPKNKSRPMLWFLFFLLGILLCSGILAWHLTDDTKRLNAEKEAIVPAFHVNNSSELGTGSVVSGLISSNIDKQCELRIHTNKANLRNANTAIENSNMDTKQMNAERNAKQNTRFQFKKQLTENSEENSKLNAYVHHSINKKLNAMVYSDKRDQDGNDHFNALQSESLDKVIVNSAKNRDELASIMQNQSVNESQTEVAIMNGDPISISGANSLLNQDRGSEMVHSLSVLFFPIYSNKKPLNLNKEHFQTIPEMPTAIIPKQNALIYELRTIMGYGHYEKKLTSNVNDALKNYVDLRNQTESNLEEYVFGLNLKMAYGKIGLIVGLEYILHNERFEFLSAKQDNQFGNTPIRIENVDSIQIISGVGWYGNSQVRKVVHYNSIQQWNVPLGLSYAFTLSSIRLEFCAGALFSIDNKFSGEALDAGLHIADWNQSPDLTYKKNLGLGWFGDLSCNIPLTHKWAVNTGIRVQEFPENYLNGPLSLNYRSYFLRTGLVLKL